jgi:GNAT superfamily N-acetyltransferase
MRRQDSDSTGWTQASPEQDRVRLEGYRPTDRAGCLAIFDSNVPDSFTLAERPHFAEFLDHLPGPYLVLRTGAGEHVACGGYAVAPGTTCADLCWGMVVRAWQGRGIGRLLAEARIERIRADSMITDIALNTSQHTRAFYERLGFTTESVTIDGFAPGLDRCDMRMRLLPRQERDVV